MKNIKTYEAFFGDILRLNPKRRENDSKAKTLFDEIKKDFEKYSKDLRKVSILDNNIEVDPNEIKIGKDYTFNYIFGKYHPYNNDIYIGNKGNFARVIKINKVPFTLSKNYNRYSEYTIGYADVIDTLNVPNFDRNDDNPKLFEPKEEKYSISYDISNRIFNYFYDEYNHQYPLLKNSKYKSSMSISDIKKGVPPTIKYIEVKTKYGNYLTHPLREGENESELRKLLFDMTKSDHDKFEKETRDNYYKEYKDSTSIKKDEIQSIIKKYLDNININNKRIDVSVNGDHSVHIKFETDDTNALSKIRNSIEDISIPVFTKNTDINMSQSRFRDDNVYFVTIEFENPNY